MSKFTLLHIDASPRVSRSKSRLLGREYVRGWKTAHPSAAVITRDVAAEPPPFVSEAWVEGAFTPAESQSEAAKRAISTSDAYIDELLRADQILITTPIYNLSLPAALKAWIDQIVRVNRTFAVRDGRYVGLTQGKQALVVVTSGGDSRPGTPGGAYNFLEPYLRAVLGFIGIGEVTFVYAPNMSADTGAIEKVLHDATDTLTKLATAAA